MGQFARAVAELGEQVPSGASLRRMFAYWESGERAVTVATYCKAFVEIYGLSASELGFRDGEAAMQAVASRQPGLGVAEDDPSLSAEPTTAELASDGELTDTDTRAGWLRRRVLSIGRWPVWSVSRLLLAYLALVVVVWVVAAGWAVSTVRPERSQLVLAGLLLGCAAFSIETGRRFGRAADRVWRDMLDAWTLPLALLLPPAYALLATVPLKLFAHWRVRRVLPHRLVFNMAAVGVSLGLTSWVSVRRVGIIRASMNRE